MSKTPRHRRPLIEALEPRLLFSATADIAVFDDGHSDGQYLAQAAEQLDLLSVYQQADTPLIVSSPVAEPADDADDIEAQTDIPPAENPIVTTLVFVDTAVENYETLVDDIQARVDATSVAIVYLDSTRDGLAQISDALAGFSGISAIHVISHGVAGNLQLGNQVLNENNLAQFKAQLEGWQTALGEEADILLYGCDLAANQSGLNLLQQLSDFTGADVAGSNDLTGNSRADTDWILEEKIGVVETESLFAANEPMAWQGALADVHYISLPAGNTPATLSATNNVGQSIQYSSGNYTVDQISVQLLKNPAAAAQTITAELRNGWDGGVIASATVSSAVLGDTFQWVNFNFAETPLTVDTVYWIRFSSTGTDGLVSIAYNLGNTYNNGIYIENGNGDAGRELAIRVSNIDGVNAAPTVANPLTDQVITEGATLNYSFPSNSFNDPDGDNLSYIAKLANSNPLPAWLHFNQATRTFSGVADDGNVGAINIRVTATDGNGLSTFDDFTLTVNDLAEPPFVANPIPDQAATGNAPFTYTFAPNTFGDPDVGASFASYRATLGDGSALPSWLNFNSGTRTFSGTPTDADAGTLSIKLYATDNTGLESITPDQFNIVITDTNDAPTVTIVPVNYNVNEQTILNLHGTGISVADLDGDPLTITLSGLHTNTSLSATVGTTGVTIVGLINEKTLTLTGTAAQLNDLFAGNNGGTLTYRLSGNTPAATDTLTISASDGSLSGSDTATINITAVNDAPTNIVPGAQATNQDTALVFNLSNSNRIQVADADVGAGDLEITLSVTNGTLTLAGIAGLVFTTGDGTGDSDLVFRGTLANINAALAVLTFDPTVSFNGTSVLSITTSDLGNTGTGGTLTDTDTVNIFIGSGNNAPTVVITPTDYTVNEQQILDLHGTGISVNDVNFDPLTITLTAAGVLTANVGTTGVVLASGNNTNVLTLTGTAAQLNDFFAGNNSGTLTYYLGSDTPTASRVLTISANDGAVSGSDTANINITAINDAPVNTVPGLQVTNEDTALVFNLANGNQIQIADLDSGAGDLEVTLSVTNGTLTLASVAGLALTTGDGTADSLMVLRGTQTVINNALATLTFNPAANYAGTAVLSLTTSDLGNTGTGGVLTDVDTVNITINPVNDAPTVANAIPNQNATEDSFFSYPFPVNTFSDADSGDVLTYTAQLGGGGALPTWLTFNPATRTFSGTPANSDVGTVAIQVTASDGNGGTVIDTFNIVVANTNDAPVVANPILDQNATEDSPFSFSFAPDTFSDVDVGNTLTYTAQLADGGALPTWLSFDAGTLTFSGTPTNSDVGTLTIDVMASDSQGGIVTETFDLVVANVNDAPTGANNTVTTLEDTGYTFAASDFGFSDIDVGDSISAVRIDTLPAAGILRLSGVAVTAGDVITAANIANLLFTPAPDANGTSYASFTFSVRDQSSTYDAAPNTLTIDVTAQNDAPTGANNTVTTLEDIGYTFAASDFGFSDIDVGDSISAVRIDTLPAAGILRLSGVAVAAGDVITSANIANLVFTPAADANGTSYANFTFSVRDQSNAYDAAPNTLTINVTAQNDAPTGANNTVTTLEDTGYTFAASDFGFSDIDVGDSLSSVRIDSLPAAGILRLSGVAVTAGDVITAANIANLVFTPAADANGLSYTSFTFSVRDQSSTYDAAPNTLTVNVTAQNDAPTGANTTVNATEDIGYTFAAGDFGFNDVDAGDSLSAVRIDTLPAAGILRLSGVAVVAGDVITSANIANLVFTPAPDANGAGYASFTFSVRDQSSVYDAAPNTLTIDVTAQNDAPTGANNTVTTLEDTGYTFAAGDFGFSDIDAGDSLSAIRIDSLPAAGILRLSGVAVTAGDVITTANIANLVFTPAADANGLGYASFTFSVRDQSSAYDAAPNTLTIDVTAQNDAPTGANNTITMTEDTSYTFAAGDFGFSDVDTGDSLSAVRIDTLPAAGILRLSGVAVVAGDVITSANIANLVFTPAADANGVGYASFTFSVRDQSSTYDAAPNTLTVNVTNTNDAPLLAIPLPDRIATEASAFNFQFNSGTFTDVDPSTTLSYTATVSGGGALPTWLSFDSATRTFSGVPATADVGILNIVVTANDGAGGTVADTFVLTVNELGDTDYIDTGEGNGFLPLSSPVGQSFAFDSAGATYSVNEISLYLARYDNAQAQTITVELRDAWNGAVIASDSIPSSQISRDGFGWHTFNFANVTLNDLQSYVIQVSSSSNDGLVLVSRVSGNVYPDGTLIENGVPDATGMDLAFKIAKDDGTNAAPVVDFPIADQVIDAEVPFNLVVPANASSDPDPNDTITYRAQAFGGGSLGWLTFNESTRTFSGTPHWHQAGTITVELIATDNHGASTSDFFDITVVNTNTAPTVANPIPDQVFNEDAASSFQFAVDTFADVDAGNTFTYSAQLAVVGGLPPWLTFDSATRTFSGTPANGDVGNWTIEVTANDGFGGTVTDTFVLTVANTNDAPTILNPIGDQSAFEDSAFNFQFVANTFTDVDVGTSFTYTAQIAGGGALPAWLSFDAATRTFSGMPANGDVGTVSIDVIANDNNGGTVTDNFNIVVVNTNDAPIVANPIADQNATEDSTFNFQFAANTFTDADANPLSYTARLAGGAALPAWLSFDAATRTFSGTPANSDVGTLTIDVIASDGQGGTVTDTFALAIANTNDAPIVANAIPNQTANEDARFGFTLPANTFVDVDGDVLTYSAQLADGSALPAWLSFDAATRTFSGTPAHSDIGVLAIRIIASDGIANVTAPLQLTVAAVNDAPRTSGLSPVNNSEDAAGDTVDLWAGFSDEESIASQLQYTLVSNSNPALVSGAVIDPVTGKLQLSYGAHQFGSGDLVIRAQDSAGASVETTLRVNIAPVNDTPTSTGIADIQVLAGTAPQQSNLHNVFSDIEQGVQLQYTLLGNSNPAIVTQVQLDAATGMMTLSFSSLAGGESIITLRALDAEGAWVETQFKVTVAPAVVPVIPPAPVTEPPIAPPVLPPLETPVLETPEVNPPGMGGGTGGGGDNESAAPVDPTDSLNPTLPAAGYSLGPDDNGYDRDRTLDNKSNRDYLRAEELLGQNNISLLMVTPSSALDSLIAPDAGFTPWEASDFDNEVRRVRAQMDEAMEEEQERKAVVAGLTFSVTTGLLIWSLRASSLLLTMMSMLPLWRGLDPLPILDEVNKKKKELEQQRKDREREDKNAKEVGYLFDHAQNKKSRP